MSVVVAHALAAAAHSHNIDRGKCALIARACWMCWVSACTCLSRESPSWVPGFVTALMRLGATPAIALLTNLNCLDGRGYKSAPSSPMQALL